MAKDQKGHGSEAKLGKTGRTAEEYTEHLRSSGSPETMARKKAAIVHEHRGFVATRTPKGIEVTAPNGRSVATHDKEYGLKSAMTQYARGYHQAASKMADADKWTRPPAPRLGGKVSATTTNRKY